MLARRAVEGAHAAQHAHFGRAEAQPRLLVMGVRVLHKLVPQPGSLVRPHLSREAGGRRGGQGSLVHSGETVG